MSESKISCPHCSQHILADDGYAGQTINCPACQKSFTVPQLASAAAPAPPAPATAAGGIRLNRPSAPPPATGATPPRPGGTPQPVPASTKTSGLAIASLVLSLLGCFGLTAIAGVICGHIARKRIRNDSSLSGGGLALAGLIIGYVMIAISGVYLTLFAIGVVRGVNEARRQLAASPGQNQTGEPGFTPSQPGVTVDFGRKKQLPVPADAVAGTIKGQKFTYSKSSLNKSMGLLTITEGEDFFADREVKIFLFLKEGESVENRTWNFTATGNGMFPHVHLSWKEGGPDGVPKNEIATSGYQLELKTGAISNGAITGSINLKVTGKTPAQLKGNFNAVVE